MSNNMIGESLKNKIRPSRIIVNTFLALSLTYLTCGCSSKTPPITNETLQPPNLETSINNPNLEKNYGNKITTDKKISNPHTLKNSEISYDASDDANPLQPTKNKTSDETLTPLNLETIIIIPDYNPEIYTDSITTIIIPDNNPEINNEPTDRIDYLSDDAYPEDNFLLPDPLRGINKKFFEADRYVLGPYLLKPAFEIIHQIPLEIRECITNAKLNLYQSINAFNYLLQGEFENSFKSILSLILNSSIGIAGLGDPAKEVFGIEVEPVYLSDTLETWGVGEGPYLYLPGYNPMRLRELPDIPFKIFTDPLFYVNPGSIGISLNFIKGVDDYGKFSEVLKEIYDQPDPYAAMLRGYEDLKKKPHLDQLISLD